MEVDSIKPTDKKGENLINEQIEASYVLVIDENGQQLGKLPIEEALSIAYDKGLDLVCVAPNAEVPVCKLMDYSKFRYEQNKRAKEAKKNQKVVETKELKLRPMIETHDYEVKLKQAKKFLSQGDKVKFTMRYKGREMSANDMGKDILNKLIVLFKMSDDEIGKYIRSITQKTA